VVGVVELVRHTIQVLVDLVVVLNGRHPQLRAQQELLDKVIKVETHSDPLKEVMAAVVVVAHLDREQMDQAKVAETVVMEYHQQLLEYQHIMQAAAAVVLAFHKVGLGDWVDWEVVDLPEQHPIVQEAMG
jgi:hypothetical protein